MTTRHYYNAVGGSDVEMTDKILRVGWEVRENAEEGATAITTVDVFDPDMTLDFSAWRRWLIIEDASTATDHVIFAGHITEHSIGRGQDEHFEPLGRVWTLSLADDNNRWRRRVMLGADCNRPAETDVARMQWLFGTSEIEYGTYLTDTTTYVSTASPVAMDANDYRGQMLEQVADDCAQAAGKNWWIQTIYDGADYNPTAWYGKSSLTTYSSPLSLSNDPTDWTDATLLDGSSLVWPISEDTTLRRDYSRVFGGIYLPYNGGAVYRKNTATIANYVLRDGIMPSLNVKSSAKASARAIRYLSDLDTPDERITTRVRLPKAIATKLRAGMRVEFKAVHLPDYDNFRWCRVLSCAAQPVAAGGYYDLTLELEPSAAATTTATCSTAVSGAIVDGVSHQPYAAPGAITMSIAAGSRLVIAAVMATNANVPADTDLTPGTGWTSTYENNVLGGEHPDAMMMHKAAGTTVSATYTPGYGPSSASLWAVIAAAIDTASTSPVQSGGTVGVGQHTVTLGATPTAGNMIVMMVAQREDGYPSWPFTPGAVAVYPDDGRWTLLGQSYNQTTLTGYDKIALLARCVQGGDGSVYGGGVPGSGTSAVIGVEEWAL